MYRQKLIKIGIGGALFSLMAFSFTQKSHAVTAEVSGHVEMTYMYDFNKPNTQTTALRSYDATANTFQMNTAHVAITGKLDDNVGYVVEIDHGSDAAVNNNANAGVATDLQEGYLFFPTGPVNFTAGKFVTYEGIEVIEGPSNPTISRGYLYGLAEAFTHVGAKAHIPIGEKVDLGVGLVNGRDVDTDNNEGKTAIWRLGFDFGDPLAFGFSGSHGEDGADVVGTTLVDESKQKLTSYDLTGTLGVIPSFPINFQVLYAEKEGAKDGTNLTGKWSGVGIQPVWEINNTFSIGMRVEYMDDLDRANQTMTNYTLTPTMMLKEKIQLRAEVRRDIVHNTQNAGPFVDDKGIAKGTATTASLGFAYLF